MTILSIQVDQVGLAGVKPRIIHIDTNDTVATITTAGYLNSAVRKENFQFSESDMALVVTRATPASRAECGWYDIDFSSNNWSLTPASGAGEVVLPTTASHIATYTNATGTLSQSADPALHTGALAITGAFTSESGGITAVTDDITAFTGNIITIGGNITATTGDITATDGDITATAGDIIATAGDIIATAADIKATVGDIIATAGDVIATAGDVIATAGNISAGGTLTAAGNITSTAGYIIATGNVESTAGDIVTTGSFISGQVAGGNAGLLRLYSQTTLKGRLIIQVSDNDANHNVIITNDSYGQASTLTIPDVGVATGSFLTAPLAIADVNANVVRFDVTVTAAALASAGVVILYASSGSKQYRIRELFLNTGTNFSGGGGNRLATISDGTTAYSVIPAANLQALTNNRWGTTAIPYPAAAAISTLTVAGQNLSIAYSGGTTDYAAGSVVISGILHRIV